MEQLLSTFLPKHCIDKFLVDYDFLNGPCLKMTISKLLGFAIILGSVLVKVPQIVKLVSARSSQGISIVSVSLELAAVTSSLSYCYLHSFPFSAYGDALFLVIQTLIQAALVLFYAGRGATSALYCAVYAVILAVLMSPAAPSRVIAFLYASNMPNIALARVVQIVANYRNGSTGQLSAVTTALLFLGAAARIFTSVQETGDVLMVAQYAVSALCNGVLMAQILYYWNAASTAQSTGKKRN